MQSVLVFFNQLFILVSAISYYVFGVAKDLDVNRTLDLLLAATIDGFDAEATDPIGFTLLLLSFLSGEDATLLEGSTELFSGEIYSPLAQFVYSFQ